MRRILIQEPHGAFSRSVPRRQALIKAPPVSGYLTQICRQASGVARHADPSPAPPPKTLQPTRHKPFLSRPIEHINAALRIYHGHADGLKQRDLQLASTLSRWEDARPSAVTAQMILYISPNISPKLLGALRDNKAWDRKLTKVIAQKFSVDEVFSWARILIAKTPDERVQEYINHRGPKPMFLLSYILHEQSFGTPGMGVDSLSRLIDYCKDNINDVFRTPRDTDLESKGSQVTKLNPIPIQEVLGKFLVHATRIHPQLVVRVADLAAECLEKLMLRSSNPDAVYRFRCSVFSSLLRGLAITPRHSHYKLRRYSWQAILRLLSLSSNLERPLLIDRVSYQTIRGVLLGVPKTESERDSATALSRTWPPYRILRNGMEEETPLEEFASRSVKAGTMMMEAGYVKGLMDLVTDILGGADVDGTPTIQTRSILSPRSNATISLWDLWAAQVRATRNGEEAWQAFQRPPQPGMEPNGAVFEQMIYKLLARNASDYHNNLPGDGRETFPFDDLNYSDFEKARLTPPTLDRLTSVMVSFGVPLEGRSLRAILRLAPSVREAILYIRRSALPLSQQMALENVFGTDRSRHNPEYFSRYQHVRPTHIRHIPPELVQVMVELLCRFQPNLTSAGLSAVPPYHMSFIYNACHVASAVSSRRDPRLWEIILEALSRPNILLTKKSVDKNRADVLRLSGKVLAGAQRSGDITLSMFQSFARVVRKTMESLMPSLLESYQRTGNGSALMTFSPVYIHPMATSSRPISMDWTRQDSGGLMGMLDGAQGTLKAMWQDLSSSNGKPAAAIISGVPINNYMKALAFLGDHGEMENLVRWTLENAVTVADTSDNKGMIHLSRALFVFRAFAEPVLPVETVAALRNEFEDPRGKIRRALHVCWPSDAEVSHYAESDHWGHRQQLTTLLQCLKNLQSDENDGDGGGDWRDEGQKASAITWQPHRHLRKHLSSFRRELTEHCGGLGLALYENPKDAEDLGPHRTRPVGALELESN